MAEHPSFSGGAARGLLRHAAPTEQAAAAPARIEPGTGPAPVVDPVHGAAADGRHARLFGGAPGLRLRKLTLAGFKSFADKSEFVFDQAITGVVGPNGCGKSNLVDAIKWVLGERSSKSLRGKEMIDVIFAGSAARKPQGMAAVTLTFDNPLLDDGATTETTEGTEKIAEGDDGVEGTGAAEHEGRGGGREDADAPGRPQAPEGESDAGEGRTDDAGRGEWDEADEVSEVLLADRRRIRRPLPIDADEVSVERRLYRDGKSQYLINGKLARLKDIRDLFLDTGIGADAYSIIEQGKVDAMLLASPQERRTIFEEAAGIAKYKQRRIEAQRKLEKAEQNLVRTREALDSTERRLRIVRGQAAKARRFRELDTEYQALRNLIAYEQHRELRDRLDGLAGRLAELESARDAAQASVNELELVRLESDAERGKLLGEQRRLLDQHKTAQHTAAQAEQRRHMTEQAIADARQRAQTEATRVQEITARLERLTADIAEQKDAVAALGEQLAEAERTLKAESEKRAGVLEQLAGLRAAAGEKRNAAHRIDRERQQVLASVQADDKRLHAMREQLGGLDKRREKAAAEHAGVTEQMAAAQAAAEGVAGEIAALKRDLQDTLERARERSADRGQLAGRVTELDQEFVRLDSRRATLDEMVRTRVGLGDAVRAVLEKKEAGAGFATVIAPLADLIETEAEHAAAVEAGLGRDLQGLVVPSLQSLPSHEDLAALPERAAFLPLAAWHGLSGGPSAGTAADDEGVLRLLANRVTRLRDLVRVRNGADAGVSGLLDRLLGRTLLVESLDVAAMLAAGPLAGRGYRFVARDGTVVEADGRVLAGPLVGAGEPGAILQRQAELRDLERSLADLGARLDRERAALRAADEEVAAIEDRRSGLQQRLAERERALAQEHNRVDRLKADAARLERELNSVGAEHQQLADRIAKIEADRKALEEKAESLSRLLGEQQQAAAAAETELERAQQRLEAATEQMTAARVEASKLGEQAAAARKELSRLEIQRDDAERQKRDHERHLEQTRVRLEQHETTVRQAADEAGQAKGEAERLKEAADALAEPIREAVRRVEDVAARLTAARKEAETVTREWNGLEMTRRELEVKRETLEERTLEELRVAGRPLNLAQDRDEYRWFIASGGIAPVDVAEAQERANALRDEIRKLGSVNLDAISEEETLEEKNEDLARQVDDIDHACRTLTDLITRLNEVSRRNFGEVFAKIQENFGGHDGMFRKLFGGGRAEVRLMGLVKEIDGQKVVTDETDLLESGIEVIAKPPGKEPRSISQLSGGEKTLTAVALLMSIFRSKPSCFCVLDEVDAALDEANVRRFTQTIRDFTDMSRFIVITHNKRTMQMADHLYGITQQEKGVSKRVSVRFDQVSADGTIREPGSASDHGAAPQTPKPANDDTPREPPRPSRIIEGKPSAALLGR